ncbi:hypothetical protein [Xanthomonas sp. D-109]|uniref:hypothetical protein n=1 Tax=Xanthomonas TaxID=338 RepID=UPI001ADD5A95|nr:hypothetical protein [Xanthomonas sp. D-109]MBO9883858.1 hypothetical protein [Xanthomonas sp. D-109]
MTKWMGAALAAAMLVTGCARVEGEKFVGHWVNVESKDDTIDIERNGESFMVRNTTPRFFTRKPKTESYPAIYKDGVLQVTNDGETVNFAIDEADGHLNTGSDEYQRIPAK